MLIAEEFESSVLASVSVPQRDCRGRSLTTFATKSVNQINWRS
jgi:hypothetical protein